MFELVRRNSRPNMLKTLDLLGKDFDEVGKLFDSLSHFHGMPTIAGIDGPIFSPALNFSEKENEYVASIELPGMNQEEIEISLNDSENVLIIAGEKKFEKTEEKEDYCVKECSYGKFRREIPLPYNIKKDEIEASFDKGILKLELPKKEEEKKLTKKIEIKKTE